MDIDETMDTQSSELIDSQMETEEPSVLEFSQSLIGTSKAIKVGELQTLLKVRQLTCVQRYSTDINLQ